MCAIVPSEPFAETCTRVSNRAVDPESDAQCVEPRIQLETLAKHNVSAPAAMMGTALDNEEKKEVRDMMGVAECADSVGTLYQEGDVCFPRPLFLCAISADLPCFSASGIRTTDEKHRRR